MRRTDNGYGKRSSWGMLAGMLVMALACGGCNNEHKVREKVGLPEGFDVRAVSMFNGRTGDAMTWEDLQLAFAEADVVVIGEQHGHPIGLPVAATMFDDALARNEQAGLALEFFERDQQLAIDDYLAELTDEEAFKIAARKEKGGYPDGHRQMLEAAKAADRPVIAAMVPRRYTQKLTSYDGLTKFDQLNERQMAMVTLPETVEESGEYRDRFLEMFGGGHAVTGDDEGEEGAEEPEMTEEEKEAAAKEALEKEQMIEKAFYSMSTWDATMAESVLGGVRGGAKPMVLVVGQGHSDFGGGVPHRLIEADSGLFIWTISMQSEWSEELREEDEDRADCVVYVGPRDF